MNHESLKAALGKLLAHGEKANNQNMRAMADKKKGVPPSPDLCPECKQPLDDGGQCPKCGYTKPETTMDEGDDTGDNLASLLESAGKE